MHQKIIQQGNTDIQTNICKHLLCNILSDTILYILFYVTATAETTNNVEWDLSFRQSCKRKSERLKDITRNVRKTILSQQRDSHTSINNGDVTHRQSFVGISNGKNTTLFSQIHIQVLLYAN